MSLQDITNRKQAEQTSILAERNRLAQEIHDSKLNVSARTQAVIVAVNRGIVWL
ncbi:hypothetical protein [Brasilonema sp. UFV-L1]|uniref:hypothetical protein n=1 Tax=Brasilonema sp. UFV-L1 TaxID=2234130 RepID=UPI00145DA4A6|nr:hypothetical protein [Brasilonema sp. UFV-L1]